jgi:hypothetical protein
MKYIFHHLGLGDHLVCNGLVRHFVTPDQYYTLFLYSHNTGTVKFMFRDLSNLLFLECNDTSAANIVKYADPIDVYLVGAIPSGQWMPNAKNFEESFYMQYGLPLSAKWDLFKCNRDEEREWALVDKLSLRGKDYIFVHDDNRFKIEKKRITSTLPQVSPKIGVAPSIFDYCKVIELAKEVHVIESCFAYMIDFMDLNKGTFAHRYPREQNSFGIATYRNITNILT